MKKFWAILLAMMLVLSMVTVAGATEVENPSTGAEGFTITVNPKDDKDILALLKEEYNLIGVVKRLAVAKKGIYDGLAVVEQAPSSEIAKEYTAIAKMIINGNFDREDIENG